MNRQTLRFEPNQPQTVSLEFPDGVNVQGKFGPQVRFLLTENRVMYLDQEPAQALRTLNPQPGERIVITKRTETGKKAWWDFERVQAAGAILHSEPQNPPAPVPAIEPTPVSASIPLVSPGVVKRIPPQTAPMMPASEPPQHRGLQLARTPPVKPSYEEAFRECLRIVTAGLAQTGEQWSDGAKQAMVSTLMIQLGRENRLGEFRPQQIGKVA